MARRTLFSGPLFEIGHVICRPAPHLRTELEQASLNVLALTTAGVWALHDGPRRHVVATPNHAVFISSGKSYRVSFPGYVGDESLTVRLTAEGLARLAPQAMSRDGFDASVGGSRAVLPAEAILKRAMLMKTLRASDPLLIEELTVGLLDFALNTPRRPKHRSNHVERVKEAISTSPDRKWTLGELSGIAGISPCHLAHVFQDEVGTSVYRYAVRLRLATALNALLDSDKDITTIALDAGFSSHSHFTARFRAFFGVTPDGLRRTARSNKVVELRKIVTAPLAAAA
jgi:AraC-like DNA-binding protein